MRTISQWMTHLLEHNPQKTTIPSLDGVRAVACLMVLIFHVDYLLQLWHVSWLGHLAIAILLSGDTGVTLFFVLSGFLLFLPYAKSLLFDGAWPVTWRFYLRRVFRIVPGYYATLFLVILVFHREYLRPDHYKYLALFLTFFMDSIQTTYQKIDGPFWTLAVEWQFYILLPLFALAMRFIVQRGTVQWRLVKLSLCLVTIIAWGMISRYEGAYVYAHPAITLFGSRTPVKVILFFLYGATGGGFHGKFLEDFAVGMLVSMCYIVATTKKPDHDWKAWQNQLRKLSPWFWGFGLIVLVLMAMWESNQSNTSLWFFLKPLYPYYLWWREVCLSVGFGSCVLAILFDGAAVQRFFSLPPMRWLGFISFSLYMWHIPLLGIFLTYILPHLHLSYGLAFALCWAWVVFVILPFTVVFYLLIEKPWMEVSDRLLRNKRRQKEAQEAQETQGISTPVVEKILSRR